MAQGETAIRPGDTVAAFANLFDVEPGRQREFAFDRSAHGPAVILVAPAPERPPELH